MSDKKYSVGDGLSSKTVRASLERGQTFAKGLTSTNLVNALAKPPAPTPTPNQTTSNAGTNANLKT